jgi:hypothetical protein
MFVGRACSQCGLPPRVQPLDFEHLHICIGVEGVSMVPVSVRPRNLKKAVFMLSVMKTCFVILFRYWFKCR